MKNRLYTKTNILSIINGFIVGFIFGILFCWTFYGALPTWVFGEATLLNIAKAIFENTIYVVIAIIIGIINAIYANKLYAKKQRIRLKKDFAELLDMMTISLNAGATDIASLKLCKEQFASRGKSSKIVGYLDEILVRSEAQGEELWQVFKDIGQREKLDTILNFADVYKTIEHTSNDKTHFIKSVSASMQDEFALDKDIETLLSSQKATGNKMIILSILVMIFFNSMTLTSMFESLKGVLQPDGRLVFTASLSVAYLLVVARMRYISNFKGGET